MKRFASWGFACGAVSNSIALSRSISAPSSFPYSDESVNVLHLEGMDFLMREGADLSRVDVNGTTVLHTACCQADVAIVSRLVEANIWLDTKDKDGFTPLFWTLDHYDKPQGIQIANYLYEKGADATVKDRGGVGIIHWCMSTLLDKYAEYCQLRDNFQPQALVESAYAESASRLETLEFLLTLEELSLDEVSRWRDAETRQWRAADAFHYAVDYIADDRREMQRRMQQSMAEKRDAAKKIAAAERKANAAAEGKSGRKRSRGGWAWVIDEADGAAAAATAAAVAPADSAAVAAAASDTLDGDSKRSKKTKGEANGASTSAVDSGLQSPPAPAAATAPASSVPTSSSDCAAASPSPTPTTGATAVAPAAAATAAGPRYIESLSHFAPTKPHSACRTCQKLYDGETIPEACARLIWMELLRRATNDGDFGNAQRVAELLAVRAQHDFLAKRTLIYHQHPALPTRVGPAHVACSYVDEGSHNYSILRQLLAAGIRDLTYDAKGFNALHVVSELGDPAAVSILLDKASFDPNTPGRAESDTALMLCSDALVEGETIARALLAKGAHLYVTDSYRNTAFHWAVYKGNSGVLRVLLEAHKKKQSASRKARKAATALGAASTAASAAPASAPSSSTTTAAATSASASASEPSPSEADSLSDPLTLCNHWGNSVMHYACYKAFESEGHIACLRMLLGEHVAVDAPRNLSGMVPRQVVAGAGAADLRGKRALLLLNTGRWLDQPRAAAMRAIEELMRPLTAEIHQLEERERSIADAIAKGNATLTAKNAVTQELKRKQKAWRELNDQLVATQNASKAELKAALDKLPPEDLALAWTPTASSASASASVSASASTHAADAPSKGKGRRGAKAATEGDVAVAPSAASSSDATATAAAAAAVPAPARPTFRLADISNGREWTPIPLENAVDSAESLGYTYITHCIPHADVSFPLPGVALARFDPASGAGGAVTGGAQGRSEEALQAEKRKYQQKQKARAAAKEAKEGARNRGRKGAKNAASARGAAASAAARSAGSNQRSTISARTPRQQEALMRRNASGRSFGQEEEEEEAGPRCECVGPNACQDGTCPCFRRGNEKLVATEAAGAGGLAAVAAAAAADPVGRMGRLCGKLEQLCNCHELCACRSDCANRHVSRGIGVRLCVYKTADKGWGCRAEQFIRRGTFVVEYVGEVVGAAEAARRLEDYDRRGVHYVFGFRHSDVCIDPVVRGNVARTINHSCEPNLTKIQLYNSDMRPGLRWPRMAFFAARDIKPGEELSISYDYEVQEHPGGCLVCYCDTPSCKHTLV